LTVNLVAEVSMIASTRAIYIRVSGALAGAIELGPGEVQPAANRPIGLSSGGSA
jgi:hypothetical protein